MKKILLIANMVSGQNSSRSHLPAIIEKLSILGCEVTVYPLIPGEGLTSEAIIPKAGSRFDEIVCSGGDGTLNHLVNAMKKCGNTTPIGYIPSGSTNDFSRNINGKLTTEQLCEVIAGSKTMQYDLGKLQDQYFNYVAGFGAFTEVSYTTPQNIKNIFGYGAYVLNIIGTLPGNLSYQVHAKIEHDGVTEEGDYVFCGVTNSTSVGGVQSPILEKANLSDGVFEVVLVSAPRDLLSLNGILQSLSKGRVDNEYVKVFQTSHVRSRTDKPVNWTVDGEFGGQYQDASIEVIPRGMTIMV